LASLKAKVYTYTHDVLAALDSQGTRPDMVKIGNEIDGTYRDGFLNPTGKKSTNYSNFIELLNFDIMSLSYYANAQGSLANLNDNVNLLAATFNKKVMVTETAYPWAASSSEGSEPGYPQTPQGQQEYLKV
jgi:arabinogalactan endo-1,4-beta-galactosidase